MKIPCTVGILTFNSEKNLERALDSVKDFAEIIVCDGGSTDQTRSIAKKYGCTIIDQDKQFKYDNGKIRDFSGVRNQCITAAHHDWFFYIDSDEMVDKDLPNEINTIVTKPNPQIHFYALSPRIIFNGRRIEYSSNYPAWQRRLFYIKNGARFTRAVHERVSFDPKKDTQGYLQSHWHYFVTSEDCTAKEKMSYYTNIEVQQYLTSARNPWHIIARRLAISIRIILRATKNYLLHGFSESLPIHAEWSRVRHNLLLIKRYFVAKFISKQTNPTLQK